MATVKLTNVKKIYQGNVTAVHDFNLDIADQEFIVFVGPSGCGKSTTLRMVAGLEEISEGTVEIDGEIVNDLQPKDRYISMVFQNYALYPHLSVFDNIAFPLRLSKQKRMEDLTDKDREKDEAKAAKLTAKVEALQAKVEASGVEAKRHETVEYLNGQIAEKEAALAAENSPEAIAAAQENPDVIKVTEQIEALKAEIVEMNERLSKEDDEDKATKLGDKIGKKEVKMSKLEAKKHTLEKSKEALKLEKEIETLKRNLKLAEEPTEVEGELAIAQEDLAEVNDELASGQKAVYFKLSSDEIYQKVTNVAETLGITEYLARKPRALSGGQRQRVAIGRAMVKDCKVLLMDEPLSNLDAKLRNQMRAEIILLREKINTTFIYVTHDQTEAMTLGDRIVVMKDGFIMQVGTPHEVFDTPDNLFVAEFIGAPKMNTFHCQLTHEGKKYYVHPFGAKIEVDGEKGKLLAEKGVESQEVILGVRPEHITRANSAAANAIKATIQVNEMMGSEVHLHVLTEDGTSLVVRIPTISLTSDELKSLVHGKEINITFEGKVMHFFDVNTEVSLLKD